VPKRQPKRSDFASEEAFVAAWTQWREVREKNNAAVQRSREKAKLKKTQQRQALRAQEREFDALRQEVVVLRKNVSLLLKAVSQPALLTDIERAWVQTLSTSEGGGTLASQCSL
jgi:cell division protein FtsB